MDFSKTAWDQVCFEPLPYYESEQKFLEYIPLTTCLIENFEIWKVKDQFTKKHPTSRKNTQVESNFMWVKSNFACVKSNFVECLVFV